MSEGRTPPLQDPGGLHGYKGVSTQLHDSGGLHVYNMNGGSHKMAEIVPQSSVAMAMSSATGTEMGLFPDPSLSPNFTLDGSMQNGQFIEVEPLSYNEHGRMFEDIKRHSPPEMQSYFGNIDNIQNSNNMYDNGSVGFQTGQEMFKSERDNLGGYIEMLGNPETLMSIKREKPDYADHMTVMNSQAQEMNFLPNTCIADWNYYNPVSNENNFQDVSSQNQAGFGVFNLQAGPSYHSTMMNNTQVIPTLPSNVDIHNQSKKITQSIIGTEWTSNVYKSKMYPNLEVETHGRKRKNESERASSKTVKSRRKKSNELGGHSKTVASILLSNTNNSSNYKISENARVDSDMLDSSGRNELVTKLMDNLRTTVQFESFCLSFPRTDAKENAFRCKVHATVNLIDSLVNKPILSEPFPASFLMGASKFLSNFNMALENSGNKDPKNEEHCPANRRNRSIEQVEEHLPHSMVWVIKMGDKSLAANWEGQFVAAVNPVQNLLSLSVFQFMPSFSVEGIKCLQQAKLSKVLASDIVKNLEQFEVSRQLRCDISLKKVIRMYLFKPNGEQSEGCLILDVAEKPLFFQRWLHTSAEDKNKWRERTNFISKMNSLMSVIWIGGLLSELNELVALILASCPELEPIYKVGISHPFECVPDLMQVNGIDVEENRGEINEGNKAVTYRSHKQKTSGRKLGSNVIKLRAEITEVLKSHGIIGSNMDSFGSNCTDIKEDGITDTSLGISLDEKSCNCFRDYVNYCCDSAVELNHILQQKVQPRSHGYYENDFDMTLVPGGNIDDVTVGELISSKCSNIVYYSFCAKDIGQIGYERHCGACRKCRTMQFWHCYACDRCSESRLVCEFCGHLKDDQSRCVIKPLSVFKSQVAMGKLTLEGVKTEWLTSLNLPIDDIISINPPKVDMNIREEMEYNSSNAMVDQLGLLNPVGFLLGQPLVGASRKHRRYKGGLTNDKHSLSKSGSQSACSVQ